MIKIKNNQRVNDPVPFKLPKNKTIAVNKKQSKKLDFIVLTKVKNGLNGGL